MTPSPSTPANGGQPSIEGYREAEGHAGNLMQQALWVEESVDGTVAPSQRVDLGDVDTDEMRSCAQFIMQQSARIEELEKALRDTLCELSACAMQMKTRKGGSVFSAIERARAALQSRDAK